jgi:PleD family two-component response regulator
MPEPKRILLVDDERSHLDACSTLLTNKGYVVRELSDPGQILKVAGEFRPDLIFIGPHLPGFRGTYAVQMLKGHDLLRKIPVIFSADHLTKPIDEAQMTRVIERFTGDAG